jgi:enamine deaminase RidA (YjgF/YER057c/UK114 family)
MTNTTQIQRWGSTPILHRFVKHNGVAYFAGVIASDLSLPIKGQTQQIAAQLDERLAAAGSSKDRLLTAMIFVTDLALKSEMNEVWSDWLPREDLPTRATVAVADLGPNVLIEVVVSAAAET